MIKISAVIPTFNEEDNIQRAIKAVSFADEIIVIDSYSTDDTIKIVKKHPNITLLQRKFDDFSSQKNFALSKCSNDWVLVLDADEEIPQLLKDEIKTILNSTNEFIGYNIYRTFFFKGKKLRFSGYQNDKVIRVFNRKQCSYEGKVHETIKTKGKIGYFKNKILHYSYKNYDHFLQKQNHYAALKAEVLLEKGTFITPYHYIVKPLARFVKHYFIQLGFLDGFYGFIISVLHSYGVLARYLKLWQLKREQN